MKNYNNIPTELKNIPNWVYQVNKIPYDPADQGLCQLKARQNDPKTWGTYKDAKYAAEYEEGGLGFQCGVEKSGYTCLDFDHCIENGEIKPEVLDIVRKLNSYTEYSISGSGLHIWVKALKSGDKCRKRDCSFEMYDCLHYMSFTGDVLEDYNTIQDRQEQINELYEQYFGMEENQIFEHSKLSPTMEDEELIEKMSNAKNGAKFQMLFNSQCEESSQGQDSSPSGNDYALFLEIAWWTQDSDQILRIFQQSNRFRQEKLNRYIKQDIPKAISCLTSHYEGGQKTSAWGPKEHTHPNDIYEHRDFPMHTLAKPVREYVEEIYRVKKWDKNGLAVCATFASAGAIGNQRSICVDDYTEWSNRYLAFQGGSGSYKSVIMRKMIAPLQLINTFKHEKYVQEVEEYKERLKTMSPEDRLLQDAPIDVALILTDYTPASLAIDLGVSDTGIILYHDEIDTFVGKFEQGGNKKGDNLTRSSFLSIYDHVPLKISRCFTSEKKRFVRELLHVENPFLSIIAGTTDVRSFIYTSRSKDGLPQRFEYVSIERPYTLQQLEERRRLIESENLQDTLIDEAIAEKYSQHILDTYNRLQECDNSDGWTDNSCIELSTEAKKLYYLEDNILSAKVLNFKVETPMTGYLSKQHGKILKYALQIHCSRKIAGEINDTRISAETMQYAIEQARFFEAIAWQVLNGYDNSGQIISSNVETLLLYMETHCLEEVKTSDVLHGPACFQKMCAQDIETIFAEAEEAGYGQLGEKTGANHKPYKIFTKNR